MQTANILVYGAGPLGSVFAASLQRAGHNVSLLARGKRLQALREHGIVITDFVTKETRTTRVKVVEALHPEDAYDLILVIMRKNHALEILPVLAANRASPNVLFMMNNAAGPDALVDSLGQERVLIGFPSSAGTRRGDVVVALSGTEAEPYTVPFGEVDGKTRERTRYVANILSSPVEFEAEIREDMDTWAKCHVALLMSAFAPAMYACGTDNYRMARTPDAIILTVRGIKEAFRGLRALGYPIVPGYIRWMTLLPEPLLVIIFRRLLQKERMEIAMAAHADAARDEMKHLALEFRDLTSGSGVDMPVCDQLFHYLDPGTPLMPEGQSNLSMRWHELLIPLTLLALVITVLITVF